MRRGLDGAQDRRGGDLGTVGTVDVDKFGGDRSGPGFDVGAGDGGNGRGDGGELVWHHADANAESFDTAGVGPLVAAEGHNDHGPARAQTLLHGVVAAVGDDDIGLLEQRHLRHARKDMQARARGFGGAALFVVETAMVPKGGAPSAGSGRAECFRATHGSPAMVLLTPTTADRPQRCGVTDGRMGGKQEAMRPQRGANGQWISMNSLRDTLVPIASDTSEI